MSERFRRMSAQLPYLPRTLGLVWTAAKPWTAAWIVVLILEGLLPVATVYLTKALVDSLVEVIQQGGDYLPTMVLAGAMAAILVLGAALRALSGWIRTAQSELVEDHIQSLIHSRSSSVDLAFYDQPEFYDHLHRARVDASYRPIALLESLGGLLQNGLTLVAMAAVLTRFGVWLPIALIVGTLPAVIVVLRYTIRQHKWRMRVTAEERRAWYHDWLLTSRESAAEIRLFDLGGHFQAVYQSIRARLRRERIALARQEGVAELGAGAVGLLVMGLATLWMVWRAIQGLVTLGDLALFYQAFHQGLRLMRTVLDNAGQLYANILFLGNLFEFLALEPQLTEPADPKPAPEALREGIRFDNVSFGYPGSERLAVRNLSLFIPAGKITAVVGANGAGKSTIIRLLCRFYDPDVGTIKLDGVDIREFRSEDLRSRVAVLFQEPVHYNATVAENIRAGNLAASEQIVRESAEAARADEVVGRLLHGYDSLLGKMFVAGTELSVGEWQRLALARAYARTAPVIVLDEPTSAMDPWAELEWMDRFRRIADGRTALIITHRLTTARLADQIHIMEDGRVVESGTHDELEARGGLYAGAWRSQVAV